MCRSPVRRLRGGKDQWMDGGSAGLTAGMEQGEDGNTKDGWRDRGRKEREEVSKRAEGIERERETEGQGGEEEGMMKG